MKARLPLLAAALVSVLLSSTASAAVATNLFENFSTIDAAWGAQADSYKLLNNATEETAFSGTDVSGWTGTGLIFKAPSCIRLGNSSTKGVAFSPVIRLSDKAITAGTATLSFHAARTANGVGVTTTANVTVLNPDGTSVDDIAVFSPGRLGDASSMNNIDSCYTNTSGIAIQHVYTGLPNEFRLRFESSASSDGRVAIDAVLVVQDIRDTLSAPSNLALSGDAGANAFAVAWSAVANAEGYSVKLLDANDVVVSSNDVAAATTTASFTDLVSSSEYTVVVVALGNHTTTDDSAPATLEVETAASTANPPTLVVANTSWTAGVAGTSAVTATLEGDVACTVESVSLSDGSIADVVNGVLLWTPPAANVASSVTATFHVTGGGEGWNISVTLSVAATPAPDAPSVTISGATPRSFNASWSATAGGPIVSYKVRAWTGRATPDNSTGSTNENFAAYKSDGTIPEGWYFSNAHLYNYANAPVGFSQDKDWIATPDFCCTITAFSFQLSSVGGTVENSHFYVYGTTGSTNQTDWVLLGEATENGALSSGIKSFAPDASLRISRLVFQYEKGGAGSVRFGTFNVSGVNWPAADFLEGWGGAKTDVGLATAQTISNPVAGQTNYVEVTAVGPTGLSTSTIASVAVPARPSVISVQ